MGCGQKKLYASVVVPPVPVRVPSQRTLAPSVASVTLVANDQDDNEMILGPVHRSPGICFTAEEKPHKTSARKPSDEGAVQPVIASNGIPFLQMRSVGASWWLSTETMLNKESFLMGALLLIEINVCCTAMP